MLPKLCHLDNDLVIIIIYILRSSHDSYTSPGDIFFLMVYPVWPWPVIKSTAGVNRENTTEKDTEQPQQTHARHAKVRQPKLLNVFLEGHHLCVAETMRGARREG